MKKLLLLSLGILVSIGTLFAQDGPSQPIVSKAVYFDVSPPLRDMVKMDPGKIDNTWKDGVIKNNLYPFGRPVGDGMLVNDPVRQSYFGDAVTDTTIINTSGVSGDGSRVPPDTDGEVGPDHFFQCVNLSFQIFNKSGVSVMGPTINKTIWNGFPGPWSSSNDGDAIVLYDEQADRWLFSQFALPNYPNGPFYEMVAVSQTGDPTGSWYRYGFQFTEMPDYPKLSVWPDGYYMSVNRFTSGSLVFAGTGAVAFDRDAMLSGDPNAEMQMFTLNTSGGVNLLPADCDSEFPPIGTPNYFMYLDDFFDRVAIYEFHVDWISATNSTFTFKDNLYVAPLSGSIPGGIPQKNTGVKVDDFAGRLMFRLPFRKFNDHWSIVCNATVDAGGGVAGIRWWELRKTTGDWFIYQESTYCPDNHYRWMGSIAMDADGNIALGYSVSSTTLFPSIRYTGRMVNDSLNVMTINEAGIVNGGGSQTNTWSGSPSRWGDYSCISVDPSSPATFWYTQEYYTNMSSASWKTRIASFSFANILQVNISSTPEVVCNSGETIQLDANASGGTGNYTYLWASTPSGFTSNLQNPTANPTESTKYFCTVDDGSLTTTDTVFVPVRNLSAGNDTTCLNTVAIVNLYGQASYYQSLLWTTAGDGHFWKDTVLTNYYYPGPTDLANGVILTLTSTPKNPCTDVMSDNMTIHFVPAVGLPEEGAESFSLTLMPNPTKGLVTMKLNGLGGFEAAISITSIQGKFVHREVIAAGQTKATSQVDLNGFPSGIYLVRVQSQLGNIVQKLVIE
ncbi:T9SS type A sorting domain-containing protein [Bacteroidota bacterium]